MQLNVSILCLWSSFNSMEITGMKLNYYRTYHCMKSRCSFWNFLKVTRIKIYFQFFLKDYLIQFRSVSCIGQVSPTRASIIAQIFAASRSQLALSVYSLASETSSPKEEICRAKNLSGAEMHSRVLAQLGLKKDGIGSALKISSRA